MGVGVGVGVGNEVAVGVGDGSKVAVDCTVGVEVGTGTVAGGLVVVDRFSVIETKVKAGIEGKEPVLWNNMMMECKKSCIHFSLSGTYRFSSCPYWFSIFLHHNIPALWRK